MCPDPEPEMRLWRAMDIEVIGIGRESPVVVVGCPDEEHHDAARGYFVAVVLDGAGDIARGVWCRWFEGCRG